MNWSTHISVIAFALGPVATSYAQEGGGQASERPTLELGLHAAGMRGDALSPFETRLLAGGTALVGPWGGWSLGPGLDLVWVDQEATTYMYSAIAQRAFRSIGGFEPFLAAGVGGWTNRIDIPGAHASESDWMVPLWAGARWSKRPDAAWGARAAFRDVIVWEEVPCGCVEIGDGPTPATGDTSAVHNWGISAGVFVRLGGMSP